LRLRDAPFPAHRAFQAVAELAAEPFLAEAGSKHLLGGGANFGEAGGVGVGQTPQGVNRALDIAVGHMVPDPVLVEQV
jgi:hypothetical protein